MSIISTLIFTVSCRTAVECSNSGFFCESYQTCCQISTSQWACCPYQDGVCCSNRASCCPAGNACSDQGCVEYSTFLM